MAQRRQPRRARFRSRVALQDRDQPVPHRDRPARPARVARRHHARHSRDRDQLARALPRHLAQGALPRPRERRARVHAALQHLSAVQRAALILREVLGFSAAEVAGQLGTSTAAVNSALQRARKAIASTAPTQQTVLRDLGDAAVDDIVTRWTDAWHAGDVDAIVAMLADDARYSMPPLPEWYRGEDEIRAFLLRGPLQSRWRFLPPTASSRSALTCGTTLLAPTFPAASTSSRCKTDPSQKLSPSSPPTSPASDCRRASVRKGDPLTGHR